MTERAPPEGARLGRYALLDELGRGGMGRVLRALDPEIGREVAIKVLLELDGIDREATQRFLAEARITGQLQHPNVVPVHDVGVSEDGQLYYVMKRVSGQSLAELLQDGAAGWSTRRLLGAFVAVCGAVAYAHHLGVLHQDLKPDNVMLGPFGEVLVVDWGLAALLQEGLRGGLRGGRREGLQEGQGGGLRVSLPEGPEGRIVGTPGFIAPERVAQPGAPATPAADQWSLGALLYTLLSRSPPYPGDRSRALLAATLQGPPVDVRLRDLNREIPDALAEICMRALSPEPAERFADVAALEQAVRDFLEGSARRERALAVVAEADALLPKIGAQRAQAEALRAQAAALLAPVKPADPVERKAEAWALEDEAAEVQRCAELDALRWVQHLQGALELVPELHDAHVRLARHHRRALEAAEARRDPIAAAREEWLLRRHDRGHHRRWLNSVGRLTLVTDPPGAKATLQRLGLRRRRLVPVEERALGETPLVDLPLEPGSYVVLLEAPGRAVVRYPVCVRRGEAWTGCRPGETAPWPIRLPRAEALAADERYVPAGWFTAGGDPEAPDSLSRRRVWVDGFIMRRFPVCNGEYAGFLNSLLRAGRREEAERLQPRDLHFPTHALDGAPTFGRDANGRFEAPAGVAPERWVGLPVSRVDLASARAFAMAAGGRLPNELEWEKAARGVDARAFPWGELHDPAFSCMVASQSLPQVSPVGAFPFDESVYGVADLGGNLRELCDNRWTEDGPAGDGERLTLRAAPADVDYVSSRGGSWSSLVHLTRAATRFGDAPTSRLNVRGLRLVHGFDELP